MTSLQDQLLKSGLINKKQVNAANKEKRKKEKVQHKSKEVSVNETKVAAQAAVQAKAEKDKTLNAQREAEKHKKALQAQIIDIVDLNKRSRDNGEVAYHFTDGTKVKKLYVTDNLHRQLTNGLLAIVSVRDNQYELVPAAIAEKIQQRDPSKVISLNEGADKDDDEYADYQIPDDLMW